MKIVPPIERDRMTKVRLDLDFLAIDRISETKNSFKANFRFHLTWRDQRLKFLFLKNSSNIIDKDTLKDIWLPEITFDNDLENIDIFEGDFNVEIMKQGETELTSIDKLYAERSYKGSENDLHLFTILQTKFRCLFQVRNFPFDQQHCSIDVEVPEFLKNHIVLEKGVQKYTGENQLAQFIIENGDMIEINNGTIIKCQFSLTRISTYHLVSTYVPTTCIIIMSLLTLFVDEKHVEATVMVSLTNMLVMYTLYQNSMAEVPSTAYLKLLDFWLLFGTLVPCFTFVTLIFWEISSEREEKPISPMYPPKTIPKQKSKRNLCKLWAQFLLPFISIAYITGYIILVGWFTNDN